MSKNEIIQRVIFHARQYGLPEAVAVEQIRTESSFNPNAHNSIGAKGLGQFIPPTWQKYGQGRDPFDVEANLDAYGRLMRDLLQQFKGDIAKALIAYHSGPDAVAGVLRNPQGNPKTTAYYKGILQRAGQVAISASNVAAAIVPPPPITPPTGLLVITTLVLIALAAR